MYTLEWYSAVKKEWTTDAYKMAKSPKLYVEPKKSETKLWNRQSEQGLPLGGNWSEGAWDSSLGWRNVLYHDWDDGYSDVYLDPNSLNCTLKICTFLYIRFTCGRGRGKAREERSQVVGRIVFLCVTTDDNLEAIENSEWEGARWQISLQESNSE